MSARLLGVDTDQLFPLCNRFPAEFSILLTFLHHPYVRNNQYIMTLLAQVSCLKSESLLILCQNNIVETESASLKREIKKALEKNVAVVQFLTIKNQLISEMADFFSFLLFKPIFHEKLHSDIDFTSLSPGILLELNFWNYFIFLSTGQTHGAAGVAVAA